MQLFCNCVKIILGDIMDTPFANLSESQKHKLFKLLGSHIFNFNKNQEILQTIKGEDVVCILLNGRANIVNIDYNGEESLIEELFENSVFGSSISIIANTDCQIRALENTSVLVIDYNNLINLSYTCYNYYNNFIINLFNIIYIKLKDQNERIKILTQKTIRDKLLEYFKAEYTKTRSKNIYLQTSLKELADYFSINRSAMFRELRYLKDEQFIKIDGRRITLLYTPEV